MVEETEEAEKLVQTDPATMSMGNFYTNMPGGVLRTDYESVIQKKPHLINRPRFKEASLLFDEIDRLLETEFPDLDAKQIASNIGKLQGSAFKIRGELMRGGLPEDRIEHLIQQRAKLHEQSRKEYEKLRPLFLRLVDRGHNPNNLT